MSEILKIVNLNKKYNENVVLQDINLSINKGDIYGILGLSGAGKSTLVRCINGLEKFDSGKILFHDKEVTFNRDYRRKVSMIFQSFNLLSQKTVLENVKLAGDIVKDKDSLEKAKRLLDLVDLKDKYNSYPSELSGGQMQRVAIARSLMTDPEILLSDEATSALDPETTLSILDLLKDLNEKMGLTIIIISHQMNVIEKICNKVAIIDKSKIIEDGEIYNVFLSPKSDITKKLIYSGHINTKLDGKKFIKVIFNGEVETPIITNIIQNCNILVSIVYADSRAIKDKMYGQMIFKLPYYDEDIEKLERYLKLNNIHYEEVGEDAF